MNCPRSLLPKRARGLQDERGRVEPLVGIPGDRTLRGAAGGEGGPVEAEAGAEGWRPARARAVVGHERGQGIAAAVPANHRGLPVGEEVPGAGQDQVVGGVEIGRALVVSRPKGSGKAEVVPLVASEKKVEAWVVSMARARV